MLDVLNKLFGFKAIFHLFFFTQQQQQPLFLTVKIFINVVHFNQAFSAMLLGTK